MASRGVTIVSLCLVVALVAGSAAAASVDPRFEAYVPDPSVEPGGEAVVVVQLLNDADEADDVAETARQVVATLRAGDAPITVKSGPRVVGDLPDGVAGTVEFRLTVPRDATPGTYDLPLTLDYEFEDESERTNVTIPLVIEPVARFAVVDVETTAAIGERGTLTLTLENVGSATARDTTVALEATGSELSFGSGSPTAETFVGAWAPGERKAVTYTVRVAASASDRSYPVRTTIQYADDAGRDRVDTLAAGVEPLPEQTFAVRDVTSTLAIGSTGTVEATVVNTGEGRVLDAVVALDVAGTSLSPRAVEVPVGELRPGEPAPVRFTVDVPDEAVPGVRRLGLVVRYENDVGDALVADPVGVDVEVRDRHPAFAVEPLRAAFTVDSTQTFSVRVTNNLDEAVTDVTASLAVAPPLDSSDASVFVGTLEPGASAQVDFELEVTDDAIAKAYPVGVDVSYRDAAGTLKDSGPYRIGVTVTEPDRPESELPVLPIAGAVVALLIGVVWWYRRR